MSRKRKKPERGRAARKAQPLPSDAGLRREYDKACRLAEGGQHNEALRLYETLEKAASDRSFKSLITNDLGTLAALAGDAEGARRRFTAALALDKNCEPARRNLAFLNEDEDSEAADEDRACADEDSAHPLPRNDHQPRPTRVAILSFLFNWPSTGGGNVHTYELALFLGKAGFEVRHFYVCFPPWGIGNVQETLPFAGEGLAFEESAWNAAAIQDGFRKAVDAFRPDYVIVTDSWNFKPLLAEAVEHYPYILRLQAMECLCPLNNVRLLALAGGGFRQCHLHQLATPKDCYDCLRQRGQWSGSLHQAERALSGVGTQAYYDRLLRIVAHAEAVLVVNPHAEALVAPYARKVCVVTAGMDPGRFPWPEVENGDSPSEERDSPRFQQVTLLFAGLATEQIKGLDILLAACNRLWQKRHDFKLVITDQPNGDPEPFARYVGWQSQTNLPRFLHEADILVMPTIAQEALGRTAVEAMAAGRPVVASRLGGLPFTVKDGETGLLCEPGNADDLARKIEMLMDDPELRKRFGLAGRRRFEEHYAWPVIIERHYVPLLGKTKTR